jgi:signal transduction histidine kinase
MDTIRKIFVLPPMENEYDRQSARVLQVILVFLGCVSVAYSILSIVTDYPNLGRYAVQGGILVTFMLIGLILLRKGYQRLVATVEILVIWLVFTAAAYTGGGVISSGYFGYLVVLVVTGVVSGRRLDTVVVAFFCAGAGYYFVYAAAHGLLPASRVPLNPFAIWIDSLIFFAVVTGLLILTMRVTYSALSRINEELLERRCAETRQQNRREMLEKVIRLGKVVTEVADYRTVLLRIWNGIRDDLGFDRVGLFTYNASRNTMHGSFGTDRNGNFVEEWHLEFPASGDDFFARVLSRPDGYYFTSDYEKERSLRPNHIMGGVKYYAAVSAWAGDKPVALICVDQLTSGHQITDEQMEALRFFAGYAGLAIQNARLYQMEYSRQVMLEKVIRLGKVVTEVADYRTVLLRIWNGIRNDLGFDRVGIFTYDASRKTARGSYGTDREGHLTEEWQLEVPAWGDDFWGGVLNQFNGFYFTNDYGKGRNLSPEDIMVGVKYYAAVSVWAGDKPVAVICADQLLSGREITGEQLEALRLFAGYAGLAIENAYLNRELEQRVKDRTVQLEAANRELEAFSYSVSHDLRAPLRGVNGYVKILEDDFAASFPFEAQNYLEKIKASGNKMGQLIDALLAFSRIGRSPLRKQTLDLNHLVHSVIELLTPEIANRQIKWVLGDLPPAEADPILLHQVYANLLGNAVKYTGKRAQAHIEIGSETQNDALVYFVRDNGAGFDMRYAEKLFGVFQRLHRDDEFEGTGIGLAIVQRIIQRHGGRIWAEAEVDKGTTFYFTLS